MPTPVKKIPKVIINYINGSKSTEAVIYDISETTLISFGKSELSTVVLDKNNESLATNHCSILYQANNFYLQDDAPRRRKSTLINGNRHEISEKLFVGDRIRLGRKNSIEFTVEFDPRPYNSSRDPLTVQSDDKKHGIKNRLKSLFG
jgi:predicted component of type VI protein secretion system